MHTNNSYEEPFIQSLREFTIQSTLEQFDRDRKAFFESGDHEAFIKATAYWARLQLLLSNYSIVGQEVGRILREKWFTEADAFTRARLQLIEAKVHYALGAFPEAYDKTKAALELALSSISEDQIPERDEDFFFCRAYLVKAKINWRRRDSYRAKLFMALSWTFYNMCRKMPGHYLPARLLCHYGQIYLQEGEVDKAYDFFQKSKAFYDKEGYQQHFYLPETLSLFGECFINEKDFVAAETHVMQALNFLNKFFVGVMNRNRAHLHHLLAEIQIGKAERPAPAGKAVNTLEEAIGNLRTELEIRRALFVEKEHATTARIHNQLSKAYRLKGEYDAAIAEADNALKNNIPAYAGSIEAYPLPWIIDIAGSSHHVLVSLQRMAEAYWERYKNIDKDKTLDNLDLAWSYISLCQKIINAIRERYYAHESKVNVGTYAREIFELGMEILLERKEKNRRAGKNLAPIFDEIFELFRNSKSFLLLQALHPYSISSISGRRNKADEYSPEGLRNLMTAINDCFASGFERKELDKKLIHEVLSASEAEIKEMENPKRTLPKPTLEKIHYALNKESEPGDIISYFLGHRGLYAMVIQGNRGLQFEKLLDGADHIRQLKADIYDLATLFNEFDPKKTCNEFSQFDWQDADLTQDPNWRLVNYSQRLYKQLFSKLELTENVKRLYIIPDENLFNVPFGFLSKPLENVERFSEMPYLAVDFKISYHISTSLLYENHERDIAERTEKELVPKAYEEEPGQFLLFNIAGRLLKNGILVGKYNSLNLTAMRRTAQLLGVKGNDSKEGSGEQLKKDLKEYAEHLLFLHFFGHSHSDEEPCLLIEEDTVLGKKVVMTQAEIQHLNFRKSNLILINACKGGAGKTGNGEAPVSLFQAFLKAGARNIYYSLFRISQKAAKDFTCKFLTELKAGNNFIDALSNTQREFINRGATDSHPTVWASPSFIGNQMQKLHLPEEHQKKGHPS